MKNKSIIKNHMEISNEVIGGIRDFLIHGLNGNDIEEIFEIGIKTKKYFFVPFRFDLFKQHTNELKFTNCNLSSYSYNMYTADEFENKIPIDTEYYEVAYSLIDISFKKSQKELNLNEIKRSIRLCFKASLFYIEQEYGLVTKQFYGDGFDNKSEQGNFFFNYKFRILTLDKDKPKTKNTENRNKKLTISSGKLITISGVSLKIKHIDRFKIDEVPNLRDIISVINLDPNDYPFINIDEILHKVGVDCIYETFLGQPFSEATLNFVKIFINKLNNKVLRKYRKNIINKVDDFYDVIHLEEQMPYDSEKLLEIQKLVNSEELQKEIDFEGPVEEGDYYAFYVIQYQTTK